MSRMAGCASCASQAGWAGSLTATPPTSTTPTNYVLPVLLVLVFIVGLLGNGTVVLLFAENNKMISVPNTYVFSLAFGDLFLICTSVPCICIDYLMRAWKMGDVTCKVTETVRDVSAGVSVLTLTAIAVDRYNLVVNPIRSRLRSADQGRLVMYALLMWSASLLMAAPSAVFAHMREVSPDFDVCMPFPDQWGGVIVVVRFFVYYAIPLTIIALLYALVARSLLHASNNIPGECIDGQNLRRQALQRRRVAKSVFVFVLVFAVCFLPSHAFSLWFYYFNDAQNEYDTFWHDFRIVSLVMAFVNACVNPVALYCVSTSFRKSCNRLICCWKRSSPRSSQSRALAAAAPEPAPPDPAAHWFSCVTSCIAGARTLMSDLASASEKLTTFSAGLGADAPAGAGNNGDAADAIDVEAGTAAGFKAQADMKLKVVGSSVLIPSTSGLKEAESAV